MKYWIIIAGLLFSGAVAADGDFIRYRHNDPFVFCTEGMKIPAPCWVPIKPYIGTYILTGWCDPPNTYSGRPWDTQDYDALDQLLEICPKAMKSGSWNGPGRGDTSPSVH